MARPLLSTQELLAGLENPGLDTLYADRVLTIRTRRVELPGRLGRARIQKTLLGYEIQLGSVRKGCPDEATARYLALFASLGLASVRMPYNPVETRMLLAELESSFAGIGRAAATAAGRTGRPDLRRHYERRLCRLLADRIQRIDALSENPEAPSHRPSV